jgi:hypothetical protein
MVSRNGFTNQAAFETAFPNGRYNFTISLAGGGVKTGSVNLTGDAYPNTPRVSNYSAAQGINPAADFVLSWDSFVGGTAADFIEVEVEDPMTCASPFESRSPGEPGALNGASTSVVIPANTLAANQTYRGRVKFYRLTSP